MRFNHRSPFHWLIVAVVALVGLFTFGQARGQDSGASVLLDAQAGEWDYSRSCKTPT